MTSKLRQSTRLTSFLPTVNNRCDARVCHSICPYGFEQRNNLRLEVGCGFNPDASVKHGRRFQKHARGREDPEIVLAEVDEVQPGADVQVVVSMTFPAGCRRDAVG